MSCLPAKFMLPGGGEGLRLIWCGDRFYPCTPFLPWVEPTESFCDWVHRKGAALGNVWRLIDRTFRSFCWPKANQWVLHNGHLSQFQVEWYAIFFALKEDKRYDSAMVSMSGTSACSACSLKRTSSVSTTNKMELFRK